MPMPNFMRHVNKHTFNRWELARGERPVLTHVGRVSGATYRTPVEAYAVDGGFLVFLIYGADETDWAKNILAAGRAELAFDGDDHPLVNPRILAGDDAWSDLPDGIKRPASILGVDELLRLDVASAP